MGKLINNKYKLIERIGVGGTAIVYKAENIVSQEIVAIKILKEEFAKDKDFIERFRKEASAASKLSHKNIVSVIDVGKDEDIVYIVMEYVDGVTLKDYLDAMHYLHWKEALSIIKQILKAVDHAHKNQIVHRDIKPMNILISDGSDIKLTDFGIARTVSTATIQANDNSAGSVHYLSPEQARGGYVDERTDIYSIGITLYELMTGVVPFDGDTHISIALKHIDGNIIPPRQVDPEIPRGVNDLVVMATSKDPADRFQTARDMLARLNMVLKEPDYPFLEDIDPIKNIEPLMQEEEDTSKELYVDTAEIVKDITMKTVTYIMAILVGILALIFVTGLSNHMGNNINDLVDEKYLVANYIGLKADDVLPTLKDYGLNISQVIVESDSLPLGYIVDQNIVEGSHIKKGDKLIFDISGGEGAFILDDYKNEDYRLVEQDLVSKGVEVLIEELASNTIESGKILRTNPREGCIVSPGDKVVIYKSIGAFNKIVIMPELRGYTLEEITDVLADYKLRVGKVYPQPGSDISHLFPSPEPSLEPSPEPSPSPDLSSPEASFVESSPNPLTEDTPQTDPSKIYASEILIYQYPPAGTRVYEYDFIDLYFYDFESLRETKEYELDYPFEDEENIHLRIEVTPADGFLSILTDTYYSYDEFPIKYKVPKSFRGKTKVVIRINREIYMEHYL